VRPAHRYKRPFVGHRLVSMAGLGVPNIMDWKPGLSNWCGWGGWDGCNRAHPPPSPKGFQVYSDHSDEEDGPEWRPLPTDSAVVPTAAPAAAPTEAPAEEPGTPQTKRVRHNGFDKHTLKLKIGGKRLEAVDRALHPELRPAKWRRPLPAGLDLEPIGWDILTAFEDAQSDRRTNDYPYGCNELVKAETAEYRIVTKLRATGESAGLQDTTVTIKPPLCTRIRTCLLRSRHDIVKAFDRRPPEAKASEEMVVDDVD